MDAGPTMDRVRDSLPRLGCIDEPLSADDMAALHVAVAVLRVQTISTTRASDGRVEAHFEAARRLGITRKTLQNKLQKYGE